MRPLLHSILLALAGLLTVAGCDTSVNPVTGDGPPFTVYGFLNPMADTQAVQVFAVGDRLDLLEAEFLDAEVRITEFGFQ